MCYFISVGLAKAAQLKWIDWLPQKMKALPARYESISQKMKGFPIVTIVSGMCSCDLFHQSAPAESFEKCANKGGSESKIAHAVESHKKSDVFVNLHPEFRQWLADATEDAKETFLLIHWDSSKLDLESKVTLSLEEFRNEETYIRDEQLIHIKRPFRNDNRF